MTNYQDKLYTAIIERYNITVEPNRKKKIKDSNVISKVHCYLNKHKRIKAFAKYDENGLIKKFKFKVCTVKKEQKV